MHIRSSILLLCSLTFALAQEFISEPKDTDVVRGGTVSLNCVLNSNYGSHVWVKDSVIISQEYTILSHIAGVTDSSRYARYKIVPSTINGIFSYDLQITNAQLQDAGVYQCVVYGGENGQESSKATLHVTAQPDNEYPTCESDIGLLVTVGDEVSISCESNGASPATILTWMREIELSGPTETLNTYNWVVTENDDAAVFTCTGEHQLWSTPRSCAVGPFKLNTGEPTVTILAGLHEFPPKSTATFICSTRHIAAPEVSWYINGVQVNSDNNRFSFNDVDNTGYMTMADVSANDDGKEVMCKVTYVTGSLTSDPVIINVGVEAAATETYRKPVDIPDNEQTKNDVEEDILEFDQAQAVSGGAIVGTVLGVIAVALTVLLIVGVVVIRRAAKNLGDQGENGENFTMRTRYVGVLRSWFFPVHKDTLQSMSSFGAVSGQENKAFET